MVHVVNIKLEELKTSVLRRSLTAILVGQSTKKIITEVFEFIISCTFWTLGLQSVGLKSMSWQ